MAHKGKILVIDDDPDFLEFTRIVLESGGYAVYTVNDVDEGMEAIREIYPDVVILDVMISYRFDGLNVTRKMRSDSRLDGIKLIMVSAIVNRDEVKEECNYDCFMSKPILPSDLLDTVGKYTL